MYSKLVVYINYVYILVNFCKKIYNTFWYFWLCINYVFKKYIYTINHKRIALNYFYFTLWTAMSGTLLATMIRLELSLPGSHFFKGDSIRYLQVITAHGLIMIFFVTVPLIFGFLANFFIPYHIGSKDVSFPRLNSIGFWLQPVGFLLLAKLAFLRPQVIKTYDNSLHYEQYLQINNITNNYNLPIYDSFKLFYKEFFINRTINLYAFITNTNFSKLKKNTFFVKCTNANYTLSGWTFITPFSSQLKYTGYGAQDVAIFSVIFAGVSTTISFTNLLITRRVLSMPGLKSRKTLLPFLTITLFLVMRMLSLITPVLAAAMIMLISDRHFNTSFFDYSYGGDVILFNHLFWFFGHPEVYVIIIPAFGIANMLLPFYTTRRIAGKNHLIWATYIMAYMGFLVWGHHMYLVGLDHRARAVYSTVTVMIALPAVVKIVNWTLTLLNGSYKINLPFIFIFNFFLFFICGGLTGMWLSHIGLNIYVHDTFYIVAHFHFMFSCSTFSALFAAYYYYFYIIFGIKYSKTLGYIHAFYWVSGQWLTFIPLFWVGYNGLPRRYHDYPLVFSGWHGLSTSGHILNLISIFFFYLTFIDAKINNSTDDYSKVYILRNYKRCQFLLYKLQTKIK